MLSNSESLGRGRQTPPPPRPLPAGSNAGVSLLPTGALPGYTVSSEETGSLPGRQGPVRGTGTANRGHRRILLLSGGDPHQRGGAHPSLCATSSSSSSSPLSSATASARRQVRTPSQPRLAGATAEVPSAVAPSRSTPTASAPPPPPTAEESESYSYYTSDETYGEYDSSKGSTLLTRPSRVSAGQSSYDSSSSLQPAAAYRGQRDVKSDAPAVTASEYTEAGEEAKGTKVVVPAVLHRLLAQSHENLCPRDADTSSTVVVDVDVASSDASDGEEDVLAAGKTLLDGLHNERHVLRQYNVLPLNSDEAALRAVDAVAVRLPDTGEALNVDVISQALRAYEERRNEALYPSPTGQLAPPEVHRDRQRARPAAARGERHKGTTGPAGGRAQRHSSPLSLHPPPLGAAMNGGRASPSSLSSSSCGCATSCTCRSAVAGEQSVSSSGSPHRWHSGGDSSVFSTSSSASVCSTCGLPYTEGTTTTSACSCSCASCAAHRHGHRGAERQQLQDPFCARNLLASPQLLFLPTYSKLRSTQGTDQRAQQADAADDGDPSSAAPLVPPLPFKRGPEDAHDAPAALLLQQQQQRWGVEEAHWQRQQQEQHEHRCLLEDALAAMSNTATETKNQLQALQAASEARERTLEQRLQRAEEQLEAKSQALSAFCDGEAQRLEAARQQWEAGLSRGRTERASSPIVPFAVLAQEEYARQREQRRRIDSKGCMTCVDPEEEVRKAAEQAEAASAKQWSALLASALEERHAAAMDALRAEETRQRAMVEDGYESESRMLTLLRTSLLTDARLREENAQQRERLSAWEAQRWTEQWQKQMERDVVGAEEAARRAIAASEERAYLEEVVLPSVGSRASVTAARLTRERAAAQEKTVELTTTVEALQREQQESLERERGLRLQLLNALRMPTTTILQRPSYLDLLSGRVAEDRPSWKAGEEGDDPGEVPGETEALGPERRQELLLLAQQQRLAAATELPVHRRFARAHQEAVKAVRAQHRQV